MADTILFWLAAIGAAAFALTFAQLVLASGKIRRLRDEAPLSDGEMPSVSIVVPARNEARGIEAGVRSLLAQDVPRLEIILVEDRSDDATPQIADRLAAEDARLRVIHVTELPDGWLGKNHALHLGAGQASGELILFTDADVVMAPDTLRRAAGMMKRRGLDHLTAGMRVDMPGWLLQVFGVSFGVFFTLFAKPWKASDPRATEHVGIGAFNLLRAEAYRRIGGHAPIAMRPDDDMKLAKLLKKNGLRQDFVAATDHIVVAWYHTLGEVFNGLLKNGYAGVDYRISLVILATVLQLVFLVFPFVGVWITHGWTRALHGVTITILLLIFAGAAREQKVPAWYGIGFPLGALMFLAVIWNATIYALRHDGIDWRGTHYPLAALKANRV